MCPSPIRCRLALRNGWHPAAIGPDLLVVGVPSSSASLSPSEAWRCPGEVRSALARLSVFDGERGNDLRVIAVADGGGWPEVDPTRDRGGLTVMNTAMAFLSFVSGLTERGRRPVGESRRSAN